MTVIKELISHWVHSFQTVKAESVKSDLLPVQLKKCITKSSEQAIAANGIAHSGCAIIVTVDKAHFSKCQQNTGLQHR
jgi:hypothetical protein